MSIGTAGALWSRRRSAAAASVGQPRHSRRCAFPLCRPQRDRCRTSRCCRGRGGRRTWPRATVRAACSCGRCRRCGSDSCSTRSTGIAPDGTPTVSFSGRVVPNVTSFSVAGVEDGDVIVVQPGRPGHVRVCELCLLGACVEVVRVEPVAQGSLEGTTDPDCVEIGAVLDASVGSHERSSARRVCRRADGGTRQYRFVLLCGGAKLHWGLVTMEHNDTDSVRSLSTTSSLPYSGHHTSPGPVEAAAAANERAPAGVPSFGAHGTSSALNVDDVREAVGGPSGSGSVGSSRAAPARPARWG